MPNPKTYAPALVGLAALAFGLAGAPAAGADDRTCTNTLANTTICSRPGGSTSIGIHFSSADSVVRTGVVLASFWPSAH